MKIRLDKIGSVLKNVHLPQMANLSPEVKALDGEAVFVEVLNVSDDYNKLELVSGKMAKIKKDDLIAGVFGKRKALEGIVGQIPTSVKIGDELHLLNLGGLVGQAVSWNKNYVAFPTKVKILGAIVADHKTVNIHDYSPKFQTKLAVKAPMIIVLGTGMGAGKTTVACNVISVLAKQKKCKVAAAKLTGVATQRDILAMKDSGASSTLSFHDVGLTSTLDNNNSIVIAAKTVLNILSEDKQDFIVAELGDGIIGWYGVDKLLDDAEFIKAVSFTICCAHDLVGAVGADEILKKKGIKIDFFAGPVTNNSAGTDYLEQVLKIPAQDIREDKKKILKALAGKGVFKYD